MIDQELKNQKELDGEIKIYRKKPKSRWRRFGFGFWIFILVVLLIVVFYKVGNN